MSTTHRLACPLDCPDTCSMIATVQDGIALTLRGDADHAFTDGYLCQKVSRYLERVYHRDRLKHPQIRTGPKGAGQFRRASWEEAIQLIAERFAAIAQSASGPQAILPYSYCGTMGKLQNASLDRRFFHRLGASLLDRTICASAGAAGCDITLGTRAWIDPEAVRRSRYIVNWGSNTSVTNLHLWTIMHRARKAGAKIVTIDPHRSKTAAKSDWWLPIRPGTDAALALGMMHVIFREGLHDDDYLARYCLGDDQLRDRVDEEYAPAEVAKITGVSEDDIVRLAREYATTSPAFIRLNYGLQRHGGGGMAVRTIACLPAVIGAWRHAGGGALLSTSKCYPFDSAALERPDLIPPGTRTVNMNELAEALLGELPGPPVQGLYVYNANPATVNPDQRRVLKGLARDDLFTVVHEQFPTDTAAYADVLLPATTQLEQFDIHSSYGHLDVLLNAPVIPPLAEAKCNTDVFRLLGRAMGFEAELFDPSDEDLARLALHEGRQQPALLEGITVDRLRERGPMRLNIPRDYAPFAEGNFGRSGRCELLSPSQLARGEDALPHYVPPHEDPQTRPDLAARFPLQMICPPSPNFMNSTFVNVDSLRPREPHVELHPRDAEPRGIVTGQMVRIFNDRGAFFARAQVGATVQPGVVVTLGTWWKAYTKDGLTCNAVTSTRLTDLGGGATFFDNLVEVERDASAETSSV
jgi:anaerobic selenocysteine-containing dehydrogenase